MLDKHFDAATIEEKWRRHWEEHNLFDSTPQDGRENYCIMLPPPNVTGALHMGHAFQHALMDTLIRRARMRGYNVLWQAGTDHAGIATQIVVSRELSSRGVDVKAMSRDEFLRNAWQWKAESGGEITAQMRRFGASCDWQRERFTMDNQLSEVVTEVFARLYEEGLIYQGKRLVNWDPVILTAVSDLEVISSEEAGVMYYVRYPFVENEQEGVVIGTTRPETILVDGAIAVHPDDARYQNLIGRRVRVPLTEPPRHIEIIADTYVEPDFGTGCVKITAAHDFNDYEVYRRHPDKNIPVIVLFTPQATMNENAPFAYRGLDRFVARQKIVEDLTAEGLLIKQEAHTYKLPRGDRSSAVVEPMLTDQWFMNMEKLAARAWDFAERGELRFVPDNWRKVYRQWLDNIQDWCISRQLMWGHQIPAWYDDEGNCYVARNEAEAIKKADGRDLKRSGDVLDTWFSSALWPFSTLDWPDVDNVYYRHYFPTSVLITGFDIIFFWVARMVMMSGHFTGTIPFRDIYITGLVRDAEGQKMSKSKGNVLDPLDLIDGISVEGLVKKRVTGLMNPAQADSIAAATRQQYPAGISAFGVDALRFTFVSLASYGRDIKFDLQRCAGYRNFCDKIWNAARFVTGVCENADMTESRAPPATADLWIVSRLQRTVNEVSESLDIYRFDLAATALHRFFWTEYCDWYVEMAKLQLRGEAKQRARARYTLATVLEEALRLLHPFMPFLSEELWEKILPLTQQPCALSMTHASYPIARATNINDAAERQMNLLIEIVDACRRLSSQTPSAASPTLLVCGDWSIFAPLAPTIKGLCRLASVEECQQLPPHLPQESAANFYIALDQKIDVDHMRLQINKNLITYQKQLSVLEKTLSDVKFAARAPAQVVAKKQNRYKELQKETQRLRLQLNALEKS